MDMKRILKLMGAKIVNLNKYRIGIGDVIVKRTA